MTRTLITGAGGFTGHYVAPLLAEGGHEVHGIVHAHAKNAVPGVHHLYEADLADFAAISEVVAKVRPDYVVHLAAIAFVAHSDVGQMYRSNVVGTRQLLQALAQNAQTPRSVIIASSANVYGNAREGVLDESMSLAPANDYGVSKVAAEYVASLYSASLPLTIVRPFNYTGRGQSPQFIIPKIVAHVRQRAPFIELGNLDVARDFSDVRVVANAYVRLLTEPKAIGGTFNICSGEPVTLEQILDVVSRMTNHELEVRVNPALIRTNEVRSLHGSRARLESVIGKLPPIPLEDTLSWMLED